MEMLKVGFVFNGAILKHQYFIAFIVAVMWEKNPRHNLFEPRREKTGLRGFRPGLTQTDLYGHRSKLES